VIGYVAAKVVGMALHVALSTMDRRPMAELFDGGPIEAMVLLSGAVGGFFGLPG